MRWKFFIFVWWGFSGTQKTPKFVYCMITMYLIAKVKKYQGYFRMWGHSQNRWARGRWRCARAWSHARSQSRCRRYRCRDGSRAYVDNRNPAGSFSKQFSKQLSKIVRLFFKCKNNFICLVFWTVVKWKKWVKLIPEHRVRKRLEQREEEQLERGMDQRRHKEIDRSHSDVQSRRQQN